MVSQPASSAWYPIVGIVSQPAWPAHYRRQVVEYLVDEKGLDVARIDDDGMPAAVAAVATFAAHCNEYNE